MANKSPDLPLLRSIKNDTFAEKAFNSNQEVKAEVEEILAKSREESSLLTIEQTLDQEDPDPTVIKQEILEDYEEDGLDLQFRDNEDYADFLDDDFLEEDEEDSKFELDLEENDLEMEVKQEVIKELPEEKTEVAYLQPEEVILISCIGLKTKIALDLYGFLVFLFSVLSK